MRKRPLANLNNTLLDRLVRTGLLNICFTERQKLSLLHVAGTPSLETQNLFHQSMLELNFIAVGQSQESPLIPVPPSPQLSLPLVSSFITVRVFMTDRR